MVVKVKEPTTKVEATSRSGGEVRSAATTADPLRGVADSRVAKTKETDVEFGRLKKLVPAISKKSTVSKLDVILEAIRYIDQLQDQLVDQLSSSGDLIASRFAAGKENAASESALFMAIAEKRSAMKPEPKSQ
jgi:hypothetical protein